MPVDVAHEVLEPKYAGVLKAWKHHLRNHEIKYGQTETWTQGMKGCSTLSMNPRQTIQPAGARGC